MKNFFLMLLTMSLLINNDYNFNNIEASDMEMLIVYAKNRNGIPLQGVKFTIYDETFKSVDIVGETGANGSVKIFLPKNQTYFLLLNKKRYVADEMSFIIDFKKYSYVSVEFVIQSFIEEQAQDIYKVSANDFGLNQKELSSLDYDDFYNYIAFYSNFRVYKNGEVISFYPTEINIK